MSLISPHPCHTESLFCCWFFFFFERGNKPLSHAFAQSSVLKCLPVDTHILLLPEWKGKATAQGQAHSSPPPCFFCSANPIINQQPGWRAACNSSFMLPASLCLCQTCPLCPSTGLAFTFLSVLCPPDLTSKQSWKHSILVSLSTGTNIFSLSSRPVTSQDYREEAVLLCPICRAWWAS